MLRLLLVLAILAISLAFPTKSSFSSRSRCLTMSDADPTFKENLPKLLKAGLAGDRPSPDLGSQLRSRYKSITEVKRKASKALSEINPELAAELEELADELKETSERFVAAAETWDAWGRPSPDLPQQLREKKFPTQDPTFAENLGRMMKAGLQEREAPELPSALRMLKYKNSAEVKRIASSELKKKGGAVNEALAAELEEVADEIEESHQRFLDMARGMAEREKMQASSKSTR